MLGNKCCILHCRWTRPSTELSKCYRAAVCSVCYESASSRKLWPLMSN